MPLTPTQRIELIKAIAGRLGTESWSLIDVTLTQFGLPTASTWSGTTHAYVLAHVQSAPDQTLIDLAQHVGYNFEQTTVPGVNPPFWRKDMLRLFISHLATQKVFAAELQEGLVKYGISAFVAHNDIEPTLEWQGQIEAALTTCEALLALLHDKFHASNWTDQEIGFAMGRAVPAFAVRFGETPYGFIARFQAFNGNGKTASELSREIFDSFSKNKQTQRKMSEVLVALFEQSGSFAQAKERIGLLEKLDLWAPSFSARIRAALEANSQISSSFGVPARIEALVKKWENAHATSAG